MHWNQWYSLEYITSPCTLKSVVFLFLTSIAFTDKSFLMALMILTPNVKQVSVIALWSTSWHRTKWWMKLTHFSTQVVVMGRPAAARTGRWKNPQDVNCNILSRPGGVIMWWNKNNQKHGAQAKMEWADSKSTVMGETISKASTNQTFR